MAAGEFAWAAALAATRLAERLHWRHCCPMQAHLAPQRRDDGESNAGHPPEARWLPLGPPEFERLQRDSQSKSRAKLELKPEPKDA